MKLEQFIIGETFFASGGFQWLCTDKGTRTITAIMLEPDKRSAWFVGPPYHVTEVVFDEYDIASCGLDVGELSGNRSKKSAHPHFLSEDVFKMLDESISLDRYPNKNLIKRDRVGQKGEIYHPYGAVRGKGGWKIKVFEIFSRKYSQIHEDDFVQFTLSSEDALIHRKDSFKE